MTAVWPKRCVSLVKNELKFAGPFGIAAMLCGTVFVDRLNHEKALQTLKDTAQTIVDRNVSLELVWLQVECDKLFVCFLHLNTFQMF